MMRYFFAPKLNFMVVPILIIVLLLILNVPRLNHFEQSKALGLTSDKLPNVFDPNMKVEQIFQKPVTTPSGSLSQVSSMTFLGTDDILLLNKNDGTVQRILNGSLLEDPLLDVNVANKRERGLLGIASSTYSMPNDDKHAITKYVFLYFTESNKDGNDVCPKQYICKRGDSLGNRLYRYQLEGNKLVNPKLLLDLPASPGPGHNGGEIAIGPDNYVYVTIGDLNGHLNKNYWTKAQNFKNGTDPDGRSGILRITQDGKTVGHGILGRHDPLNKYYAYGIRNSFGTDFDPVKGNLWDTENGPEYGDEINLVKPGFNSGWIQIQGIWEPTYSGAPAGADYIAGTKSLNPTNQLVNFGGSGRYSPPEFIWKETVAPTAIKFLHSNKYGKDYKDDLFVGDVNNGNLYHFDLNKDRSGLLLNGPLQDKIADNREELKNVIFATGFGNILDLEVGPDGYLYVLSEGNTNVNIFKLVPTKSQ
jgi:aldose sugar dehydrogenase